MALNWYVTQNSSDKTLHVISEAAGSGNDIALNNGQTVNGAVKTGGPYTTQSAAAVVMASQATANAAGGIANTSPGVIGGVVGAVTTPLSGITAIGDFFSRLTEANTWIRLVEGLLGLGLLVIGLAKLSGAGSAIGKAVKLA